MKKRVLLVEPSPIVSEGLSMLLKKNNVFDLTACYTDVSQLNERCIMHRADILIINPTLMSYQNRASIRSFFNLSPNLQIVALIYSFFDDFLLQQFDSILTINDDSTKIEKKLQTLITNNSTSEQKIKNEDLTERETEILVAMIKGLTNKEIAEKFFISIHTVISHRKNIVRKTGIKSLSGLTVFALINHLVLYEDIE